MQPRRTGALATAVLVTLAACGSGSDDAAAPVTENQPAPTDAVADGSEEGDPAEEAAPSNDATDPADAAEPGATDSDAAPVASEADGEVEQAADEASEEPDAPAEDDATEDVTDEPAGTEAPAPAEPVVGGRLLAADVQPEAQFDGNPFPDLVVDDIGKDAQVNVANILPSDRPVLLWAWAPH